MLRFGKWIVLLACAFAAGCTTGNEMKRADKAKENGHFSEAYELYATVADRGARRFSVPAPPRRFHSWDEFNAWEEKAISSLVEYEIDKPKDADLDQALEELKILEPKLAYLEGRFQAGTTNELTIEMLQEIWREEYFSNQKALPPDAIKKVHELLDHHISLIALEGDHSSFIDGVFYNQAKRLSVPFRIGYELTDDECGVFLSGGDWVALMRVVPEKSNPKDAYYRKVRDVVGRFSTWRFSVSEHSQVISLRFRLHRD
jgi:hypothetical protein